MVDVSRSDNPFTPRGTLTVVKDRVQLNIHPGLFGGFTTDVMLTDIFAGATVAQFSVDENIPILLFYFGWNKRCKKW